MQTVGCTDECREKKKQKKISDLLVEVARDVDGCGCGWMRMRMDVNADAVWMRMRMWCRCGWDADAVDMDE